MSRQIIESPNAPKAIGPYSQAVRVGKTVYLSGQIALDPSSGQLVDGGIDPQVHRVFRNLKAVAEAAEASLEDAVRLTIYLTELTDFARVNEIMAQYFKPPYPARATLGVAALPKAARVEIDAILVVD